MEVRLFGVRGLPRKITAILPAADTTKQVNSPTLSRLRLMNTITPGSASRDSYFAIADACCSSHT